MVKIFGQAYYFDLDAINEECKTGKLIKIDDNETDVLEINVFKYEILKMCIERVLNEFEQIDEKMGQYAMNESSISFKIAFNTLIKNNVLLIMENNE